MPEWIGHLQPPAPLAWAIGILLVVGGAAWVLRLVRRSAFIAGVPLGAVVLYLGGGAGFIVLFWFFLLGTLLTRLGYSIKEGRGVAEAQGGRRGAPHVAANCGTGLLLLIARAAAQGGPAPGSGDPLWWAAFAGSFATAASDTASSEIGQLWGRRTVLLPTLRPVPVGTQGAVSIEGLLAGLGASTAIAAAALAVGLLDGRGFVAVALAGFVGNLLESLAGSRGRRALPHGLLNFANTVAGALLAAFGAFLFGAGR